VFPPSPVDRSRPSFQNIVLWTKSKNPVILSVICHRQNPVECTYNHYPRNSENPAVNQESVAFKAAFSPTEAI
jgi:hypothetical protein